jgi:hypothetical protein
MIRLGSNLAETVDRTACNNYRRSHGGRVIKTSVAYKIYVLLTTRPQERGRIETFMRG